MNTYLNGKINGIKLIVLLITRSGILLDKDGKWKNLKRKEDSICKDVSKEIKKDLII